MKYFFCKLVPPRPSFAFDMNPEERAVMQRHALYLQGLADRGWAVVFGPVGDPAGPFGLAVFELPDGVDIHEITANDPAIASGVGLRYEIHPMLRAVTRSPKV
jgi:uncharacterized protein YciI